MSAIFICMSLWSAAHAQTPERVSFPSQDGKTTLTGYLYLPHAPRSRAPAIVMMHGRAGAYSSLANGVYDASTLSKRHQAWGALWAAQGYVALMVDGFGPRGHAGGFPRHSYDNRPAELNEVTVRPLDAYGALAWLRARGDVDGARIGLQGWSNGGSATLAAMASGKGFAAALVFYPACGLKGAFEAGYKPYAPVLILAASEDDEVSPEVCRHFSETMRSRGEPVDFLLYQGAHHSYDDPGKTKQSHAPNRTAMQDSLRRAEAFFDRYLKP